MLLTLTVALLAFGEYGNSMQAVRVLSIISIPSVAVNIRSFMKEQSICYLIYFFVLWYLYNLVSMAWTPDIEQASKELFYYIVHFNIVLSLILFSRKAKFPIQSIIMGWITMAILLIPLSLYELATDFHMSIARVQSNVFRNGAEEFRRHYAAATFFNYNDYNAILVWTTLFLFLGLFYFKNNIAKILFFTSILSIFFIIITNASRGSLLALMLIVFAFVYYYSNKNFVLFLSMLALAVGLLIVVFLTTNIFDTLLFRTQGDSSNLVNAGSRAGVYENALNVVKNNWGTGGGIGSSAAVLRETRMSKVTAPHNLLLETLVQYGFIITTLFFFWMYYTAIRLISNKNFIGVQFLGMAFLLSFAFSSVVSSVYLLRPALWVMLGCMFVVYDYAKTNNQKKLT